MKNPLERTCEEYFIELLKTNTDLAALDIRHFDDADPAKPGIVVEAIQGQHRLDGPKGHDVRVSVLYRSTTTAPEDNDKFADLISDTVFSATPGQTTIETDFTFLLLKDDMSGTRNNAKDLRKREKSFLLIARIDATP